MNVRIGIDVGGTFTDAVAVDDVTYELIGTVKIPTTHTAKEGVAAGIVEALNKLMEKYHILPEDVVFIAHGTTQATNALLEGDVESVGILTLGKGVEGLKARTDTAIGDIELAKGKMLHTCNAFVNTADMSSFEQHTEQALDSLREQGAVSVVATEAFSVDHPDNEMEVLKQCSRHHIAATAGSDVSKLYGLKVRTRTAVVNASILPKMIEVANLTEESIQHAGIEAPLMVMRCDGGVMTIDEVRGRPILTILSGPAAGVAGALMYEKLTDGIFLEVGGTSTDISCVRDGSVLVKYAEVGGHKTYLNSLDVRTVGIGGGSMVRLENGKAVDTGPRSAHIANLAYEVYAKTEEMEKPVLKGVHPVTGDPEYGYVECANGRKFALTLSGAANIAGYLAKEDYARGNIHAARMAWEPLAKNMCMTVEEAARTVLDFSAKKNGQVVESFLQDYKLKKETLVFVGGGGGASTVVPHLAETFGCKAKIARNAPVISPIGVSLAMVREMIERTVHNPTQQDILSVRSEAFQRAIQSGASPETVEVTVSVRSRENKICAVATGATEMRTKDLKQAELQINELKKKVAENMNMHVDQVVLEAENDGFCVFSAEKVKKSMLIFKKKIKSVRLIDRMGVIRLQRKNAVVTTCMGKNYKKMVQYLLDEYTMSGDGGEEIPNIYIVRGKRIITLSGMQNAKQLTALCDVELAGIREDEKLIMVCTLTAENERG